MRDIAITLAVFGSLPFILKRPWIGILVWSWLGFMNPHRLAWGFSMTMPFAMIVALTTLLAMASSKDRDRIPWTRETLVLLIFVLWMTLTTFFAVYSELAWEQWEKVVKIQLMIFVAMKLITTPMRLQWLVFVITFSIGFYGVKGGIFTLATGGAYRVQGPSTSFIGGNNEIGLALAMTIPLLYFAARHFPVKQLRAGILIALFLTAVAAIGTQSRGALLGMAGMSLMFWWKTRQKFTIALLIGVSVVLIAQFMPESWYERMNSIKAYDQDESALGRLNAWHMAFNLALHRLLGGGFECFRPMMFSLYAPDPNNVHDAHSVYFELLGEHGFLGLGMFLLLAVFTWTSANRVRRKAEAVQGFEWLSELLRMVQASMVAYATAGTFLGMAYFDYYYNLVLIVVVAARMLEQDMARSNATADTNEATSSTPQRRLLVGS